MPAAPGVLIRPYRAADRAALYDICLRTGLAGGDASGHYEDPDLLPSLFAGPYAALDPELVFVADSGERPIGYIVGTADSVAYYEAFRRHWLPALTGRFPEPSGPPRTPDEEMRSLLHHPERMLVPEIAERYPAHLHIDLLPEGQGRGLGTRLMHTFWGALRERGVPGVHLGMSPENTRARLFYDRLGFTELLPVSEDSPTVYLGRLL
ncbi:N-acetyltransferase [Streptomyces sodiiphilus]|uniref:N-acetyltransferase n=1 Tax=Streptomyces sodiiphilus TaxID=226217 RepID=A0ABP5A425_9ACTN